MFYFSYILCYVTQRILWFYFTMIILVWIISLYMMTQHRLHMKLIYDAKRSSFLKFELDVHIFSRICEDEWEGEFTGQFIYSKLNTETPFRRTERETQSIKLQWTLGNEMFERVRICCPVTALLTVCLERLRKDKDSNLTNASCSRSAASTEQMNQTFIISHIYSCSTSPYYLNHTRNRYKTNSKRTST